MERNELTAKYSAVCAAPGGNGFRVEHMPQLFAASEVDDCSPHVHSFYEILWFQEGSGHHTVDFMDYEVRPGTIFFLSPGQVHNFDSICQCGQENGYRGVAIKMCTDFMRDEECAGNLFLKYNVFHTYDTTPYYYIDESVATRLHDLVSAMEDEAQRYGEFGNTDVLKSLLRIFLVTIHRYGSQETPLRLDILRPSHQLFIQFRKLVDQEYAHLHSVQDYADRLNVAVRTLNKSVNECSQKSPLTFINNRIILEAKRMIRYSNMMIKEIAFELGYYDPSYFVKLFKRQTGHLPSEFREMDSVVVSK